MKVCTERISPPTGNSESKRNAFEQLMSGVDGAQDKLKNFFNRGKNKKEKADESSGDTCHGGAYLMPKKDCGLFSEAEETLRTPCSWKQGGHRVSLRKTYSIRSLAIKVDAMFPTTVPEVSNRYSGTGDMQTELRVDESNNKCHLPFHVKTKTGKSQWHFEPMSMPGGKGKKWCALEKEPFLFPLFSTGCTHLCHACRSIDLMAYGTW